MELSVKLQALSCSASLTEEQEAIGVASQI